MKLKLIGLLILTVTLVSCSQNEKPDNFDYGHTENNHYVNSFFGLELNLPDKWVIQTKEQTADLSKRGKELVSGDDENLKKIIDVSEVNSANLLMVFQYEVGTAVDYNPSFSLIAENLKSSPGIKTGGDYLFQVRKLLQQSQMVYSHLDETFAKEGINGQEFYTMNCAMEYMGITIKQKYYSTLINGFSLGAIISYIDDEQKGNLEEIINSMNFKR